MKVLFLTRGGDLMTGKKDGGALGTLRNLEMLKQICGDNNVIIDIIADNKKEEISHVNYFKGYRNLLCRYIDYISLKTLPKNTEKKIVRHINELKPDIIFFDGSVYGQVIKNRLIKNMKTIVFFHNVERQYTWDQVKKHSILCLPRYIATRYNEKRMALYGQKIICLNNRDKKLITKYYSRDVDLMIPVTFQDTYYSCNTSEVIARKGDFILLYIGSYYIHNYTGLIWFINNVIPYVNAKLVIVGKNMEKIKKKIVISDKIIVVGTVDELAGYYAMADAMVMPIFMGGGMKVKTAEALMYGKTIFASRESLEGYEVARVKNVNECNSAQEFISAISECIDSGTNQKFNLNVRQIFLNNYCTEKYIPMLGQLIDKMYNNRE